MLHTHKASSEAEAAALRLMITELRASHEASLSETRARLDSLEQSRSSVRHRRPLARLTPTPTPPPSAPPAHPPHPTPHDRSRAPCCGARRPTRAL